jgi:VWFA-related protein
MGSGRLLAIALFCVLPAVSLRLAAQNTRQPPKIRVRVDSVFVPVVVRDGKGHTVNDLTEDAFQVFDNGKLISISGFAVEKRAEIYAAVESPRLSPSVSNQPATAQSTTPVPTRFIVFVFDDLHLSFGELMRVQKAASAIFAETMTETDMAAVVSLSGINSGLTHDTAKLQETVNKMRVRQVFRHDDHACPNVDYYQADLILNKHNEQALEAAEADFIACAHLTGQPLNMIESIVRSAASQSLMNGENDMSVTLTNMREVVRKMGTLSGERMVILISSGFFAQTPMAMAQKSQILDLAARCNVTISAIDARGLYTTALDASERGGSSIRDVMTGEHAQYHADEMNFNEDVMAELADGTGGTYFHNNNNLEGGLKSLAAAPEVVYLLAISLTNVKHDGSYHSLKVKVGRKGVKTQTRRGYFAPDKERAKKSL